MIGKKKVLAIFLLNLLTWGIQVVPRGNDELVWPHGPKGFFNIKSFFFNVVHNKPNFPTVDIWRSKALSSTFFFLLWLRQPCKKKF